MHIRKDQIPELTRRVTMTEGGGVRDLCEEDGVWMNHIQEHPGYMSNVSVPPGVPLHVYQALHDLYQAEKNRSFQVLVSQIIQAINAPNSARCSRLESFPEMLRAWLENAGSRGWVYRETCGRMVPYLVRSAQYIDGNKADKIPPKVAINFIASIPDRSRDEERMSLYFEHPDVSGKSVGEVMSIKSLVPESPELNAEHDAACERYGSIVENDLKQFRFSGTAAHRDGYRWERASMSGEKVVVDIGKLSPQTLVSFGVCTPLLELPVPFHPIVDFFHLGRHQMMRGHALDLELYQWRPEIGGKLVLPQHHRDLVEVLTEDGELLREDIIEGKTGGTVVLCKGPAGVGKTLTAEVYSEVTQRPLYRVHSGQLGIEPSVVEKRLDESFNRATKYSAVLLIDEADVFVRTRGDNILQNAMTSVFLRMLEYWDGLLFMTTNRSQDIDDAIISRCMAVIAYQKPELSERASLWRILSDQFEVGISDELVNELASEFKDVSGRDIKGILRLTKRYAERRKEAYSVELFRRMAMFREG